MGYRHILFEKSGNLAKITLNRPHVSNAVNPEMMLEIGEALHDSDREQVVKVVVITGAGKNFCTGTDLNFARESLSSLWEEENYFRLFNMVIHRILNLRKPVIAAVKGFALAGGFEIMLACDLVVAAEDAVIGDNHIKFGLVGPAGSTLRTTMLVGARKAKEIVFMGKKLSGKEAERIGLVNLAVPTDSLERTVDEFTGQLSEKSPVAIRIAKMLINKASQIDSLLFSELEVMAALVNDTSEDYREGREAFDEKRKPIFIGR